MTDNNTQPIISVIIPAFNEEGTIRDCLNSVLDQTLDGNSFEIIVVDNNSTDQTNLIVKNEYPKVRLVGETKQGVVFARITGVKKAQGNIITFIDADSIASRKWLKNIQTAFEDKRVVAVGADLNFQPKNYLVNTVEPVTNFVNRRMKYINGCNLSFRLSAYKKVGGFSVKTNGTEDFYISLKLKKEGKIIILEKGEVTTSSRRYRLKNFIPYATKSLINQASILIFDRGLLLNFVKSPDF